MSITDDRHVRDLPAWSDGLFACDPFRLLGSHCDECGVTVFPSRPFCPGCRTDPSRVTVVDLPPDGAVHTFTVVRQAPADVNTPYVLARVELTDGTRLMSTIVCTDPDLVEIGSKVRVAPAIHTRGDTPVCVFTFTLQEGTR
jgi:uncharacterized OB-fold protein